MRKLFIILFIFCAVKTFAAPTKFSTHVTLTTYNAVVGQCDKDPSTTADGTKIDFDKLKRGKIKYAAVSRDLLWAIPLGSIIHIEGHGYYEVRDTMNKRFNHYIDILQHEKQKNFKKKNVKITLVRTPLPNKKKKKVKA